jgi:hypothetical protein
MLVFYGGELLATRSKHKHEEHPLSAVRDCWLSIFAATLRIWRPSPPPATCGRAVPWWLERLFVSHLSTPHIIANVRHARLDECAVRATRKKLKVCSDSGDTGFKNCKLSYAGACGRVCRSLFLAGVWNVEPGGRFCVGAFGRNLASVAVKMFSHFICLIKTFYNFYTFNAICKDTLGKFVNNWPCSIFMHVLCAVYGRCSKEF